MSPAIPAPALDAHQLAVARGRAYDLVADLFRRGLSPERLPHLAQIQGVGEHLPDVDSLDDDTAAARQHRVLSREVFPYESVFLDDQALLGGDTAGALRDLGRQCGWPPEGAARWESQEPDHLAEELGLLAFLCGAEADALRDGETGATRRIQELQHDLLDSHLLRWLPVLVVALRPVDLVYAGAAEMILELAADHRAGLWRAREDLEGTTWSLPPADNLLNSRRVGLKAISKRLVTPALVGGFWSQQSLKDVARRVEVGTGFGKRWQVAEVVLSGAAHQDRWEQACEALQADLSSWDTWYARVEAWGLKDQVAPWRSRLLQTRAMLRQMAERRADVQAEAD